jgi:hypothetical protein
MVWMVMLLPIWLAFGSDFVNTGIKCRILRISAA